MSDAFRRCLAIFPAQLWVKLAGLTTSLKGRTKDPPYYGVSTGPMVRRGESKRVGKIDKAAIAQTWRPGRNSVPPKLWRLPTGIGGD